MGVWNEWMQNTVSLTRKYSDISIFDFVFRLLSLKTRIKFTSRDVLLLNKHMFSISNTSWNRPKRCFHFIFVFHTLYSYLNPAFSLADMLEIWALMFLTGIFLFVGGPRMFLSGKTGAESSGSSGSSLYALSSETILTLLTRSSNILNHWIFFSFLKVLTIVIIWYFHSFHCHVLFCIWNIWHFLGHCGRFLFVSV